MFYNDIYIKFALTFDPSRESKRKTAAVVALRNDERLFGDAALNTVRLDRGRKENREREGGRESKKKRGSKEGEKEKERERKSKRGRKGGKGGERGV